MSVRRTYRGTLATVSVLLLALSSGAFATVPVEIVKTDLEALIRSAAASKVQFAVAVPHAVSTSTSGKWSVVGDRATWRYAAKIPTAVSLSFHATHVHLPAGATLTVSSAVTTFTYRGANLTSDDLWSRIHPGDTLQFTLDVPAAERSKVVFAIVSFQAGYRGLGGAVPDHAYYRALRAAQAGTNSGCAQNYACNIAAANTSLGQATVGVVVGDMYQCTGTLVNDVPGDNTPYVLTARHCETGLLGGGDPGAAGSVTIYWDALTPCGQALGTLYDPGILTQTGAVTVIEQQDAWLIQLNKSPRATDAQFAGFDASGNAIQGGYTIQHSLGYDKQFTSWFGQALAVTQADVLTSMYTSNFWEVVNALGNTGPGASGSGLIDQNNHLVGSLTLGRIGDASGYESCPANPLAAPNGSNGAADFTSLAAVWNSTADTTSNTGSLTLKSVLDPGSTGTLVVSSMPAAPITFTTSSTTPEDGDTVQLSWSVPNSTQCIASGGIPGDGWSGSLPGSGTQGISESVGADVSYKLTCTLSGGGSVSSSVQVSWYGEVPFVQLYIARSYVWTTRPATLQWTSNVSPCAIKGGSLSLTGLASSGTTTTTQATTGDVTYTISCGSGPTATSQSQTVTYITPSLLLVANATDRLQGEPLSFVWVTWADSCTPSGGAPNDGWATTAFGDQVEDFAPRVSTLGTYTYSLTCTSGPLSVTQSIVVTYEDNAPYVTTSRSPSSTTYTSTPADYIVLNWTTNLTTCAINSTPSPAFGEITGPLQPIPNMDWIAIDGPATLAPNAPGTYTLSVTCTGQSGSPTITSTPLTVTVLPPPPPTVSVSLSPATVALDGAQFTVTWSSTNAMNCVPEGNGQGSGALWPTGPGISAGVSGSLVLGPANEPGTFTFGISCQSIASGESSASAQAKLNVLEPPTVTLTANEASLTQGQTLTLTWSSANTSSCTATGGGANGSPWSGNLATSGTTSQPASAVGSFTYTITCTDSVNTSAQEQVSVTVIAATPNDGSSGGSKGGGGALGLFEIALLASLVGRRRLCSRSLEEHCR
jgi:lysyl endopeptidase